MLTPVSFGSTYTVKPIKKNDTEQLKGLGYTRLFCSMMEIPIRQTNKNNTAIIAPDSYDKSIEKYLTGYGINFSKHTTEELTSPEAIESRIKKAPKGYTKVSLNQDKFNELLQSQLSKRFNKIAYDYYNLSGKKLANSVLKSGEAINASTIKISPQQEYSSKKIVNDIEKDRLCPNTLSVNIIKKAANDYDNYMYFAMQDAGMKNIPVYVDKDTYDIGSALGLFVED